MKKVITSENIPVKLWLEDIEEGALNQAKNLANLPFAFKHISIMPDCLTDDAEVLTNKGWKLIKNTSKNDLIANYLPSNKKVNFEKPIKVIHRDLKEKEKVYEFAFVGLNKSIRVSEGHRMALEKSMGEYADNIPKITEMREHVFSGDGLYNKEKYDISDELLSLIAWIVGDGYIKKSNKRKDGTYSSVNICFGLTKERKIKRIKLLLKALNFKFSTRTTAKQTSIRLMVDKSRFLVNNFVGQGKNYPTFFLSKLSKRQALLFINEAIMVDGDYENHLKFNTYRFNSKKQEDIDFLSALIAINLGISCDNTRLTDGYKLTKMHYLSYHSHLKENPNGFHKSKVVKREIDYEGKLTCLTCNSGFFICRQNGLTFISGNSHRGYGMPIGGVLAAKNAIISNAVGSDIGCGVSAQQTNLTEIKKSNLKKIMGHIRSKIPVGFNHHNEKQSGDILNLDNHEVGQIGPHSISYRENKSAHYQLGTLGGGK